MAMVDEFVLRRFFRALREVWIGLMMPTTST
jgi:hypothetical protein